jgi:multimeric flavodoxin WrbA
MKILGVCASPKKKNSTTFFGLQKAIAAAKSAGVKTQILNLAQYNFKGCRDCGLCRDKLDCSQNDDFREEILPLLKNPEIKGMILASPVYFGGLTSLMKAFLDRTVSFRRNGFIFENIVAGALTVGKSRNGGQELTAMDIVKYCLIHNMIMVSDASPTSHFGAMLWSGHTDGIENDSTGIETAENIGKKVAEIVKKIHS